MKEFKKIEFFLYNFKKIDGLIEEQRENYIDASKNGVQDHLKSYTQEINTLENQVAALIDDEKIRKYKEWQAFLSEMLVFLCKNTPTIYRFITYKYFEKKTFKEIEELMKMDVTDLKELRNSIIYWLFIQAKFKEIL